MKTSNSSALIITFVMFIILFVSSVNLYSINSKHVILLDETNFDATNMGLEPGDTIYIESGVRKMLRITNVHGTTQKSIVFQNLGGEVIIQGEDLPYGISIKNCSFFRLTGTGDNNSKYGIKVMKTKSNGTVGIGIGEKSTNYEIDHIEITNVSFAGIMAKTDPKTDLSFNRGYFTQYQSIFHDNYIHNTGGEGLYIGHTFYNGVSTIVDDKIITLLPSELKGVRIYNNKVDSTGWDGIQVGSATEDCEIYGNVITNYGLCNISGQQTGLQIGGGTTGKCYNNYISDGTGNGMTIFGLGNNDIYNNIIVNAGNKNPSDEPKGVHGIFVDDRATIPGSSFNFYNNTIVNSKADGIRFYSKISKNNKLYNNIIVNPGSISNYSKYSKENPYINVVEGTDVVISNNFLDNNINKIQFEDVQNNNFKLSRTSPAIEAGLDLSNLGVEKDFENNDRPIGKKYDLGAYQRVSDKETNLELHATPNFTVYPNPCRGKFYITKDDNTSKVDITIYNIQGKVVKTSKNNTDKNIELDMTDLTTNGKYYITLNDKKGYNTKTIVIQ